MSLVGSLHLTWCALVKKSLVLSCLVIVGVNDASSWESSKV